jgi:Fe-S-cluster-containing dehydrogenase component
MTTFGMVVDVARCSGCYNCALACRDEFCGSDFPGYSLSQLQSGGSWMKVVQNDRGQYPKMKIVYTVIPCAQCADPPCVRAARDGAVYQRDDGIVIIDPLKAEGQEQLVASCPHEVVFWNEEKQVAQKCTFCAHVLDNGGIEPRCVEACPTGALIFGDLDDPASEVALLVTSGKTEPLGSGPDLGERVRYIGLPRRFVAGTVVFGDTSQPGAGAEITLESDGLRLVTSADEYGDFEFEGLDSDRRFAVSIRACGYRSRETAANTRNDVYLGEIVLQAEGRAY